MTLPNLTPHPYPVLLRGPFRLSPGLPALAVSDAVAGPRLQHPLLPPTHRASPWLIQAGQHPRLLLPGKEEMEGGFRVKLRQKDQRQTS